MCPCDHKNPCEGKKSRRGRGRKGDTLTAAEVGVMRSVSQGMWAASRAGKSQETVFPTRVHKLYSPADTLILGFLTFRTIGR